MKHILRTFFGSVDAEGIFVVGSIPAEALGYDKDGKNIITFLREEEKS